MDGNELERFMRHDPHAAQHFIGVFAADTLPHRITTKPALLIVNSDPISKPGTHWLAMSIDACGKGFYFDSYGQRPNVPLHERFLSRVCKSWTYNHVDLQALDSSVCGQYCCMYLLFKAHGFTMTDFVKCFSNDCAQNDARVEKMYQRYSRNVKLCDDVNVKTIVQKCSKRCKK